jgi:dethiobiotin synthetase
MKPICCGDRDDADELFAAADGLIEINAVNPLWFRAPAAPYVAAMVESRPVDLSLVFRVFSELRANHAQVVVEGVGGWRVPITREFAVSDLARELALPIVVVAANRLGALNHTLLTVEAIVATGLQCAGVILNQYLPGPNAPDIASTTNRAALEELLQVPILAEVSHGGRAELRQ